MSVRKGLPFVWLLLSGAIVGSGLDILFVQSGVERYPAPMLLGIAWWVPLLFAVAAITISYSHLLADTLLQYRHRHPRLWLGAGELLWLVLAYLLGASRLDTHAKVGLLLAVYLNFWIMVGGGRQNLLLALVTAITGTLIEMVLVAAGVFAYLHPDFLGVPYWLPCIYACASLAVGDFGRALIISSTEGSAPAGALRP